jgi:hypothetical protein
MLGGAGMDSLLECLVPSARGLLLLRPTTSDTYPYQRVPGGAKARVPFSGNRVRWTGDEISSASA